MDAESARATACATDHNHSAEQHQVGPFAIFDSAGIGLAEIDAATGRFSRVNAAYCAITGLSEAQLLRLTIRDLRHPDERSFDENHFIRMARGEDASYDADKRYLRPDGSVVSVHVHAEPIRDASGRITRMAAVIQDVTERKRAEEALRASEERLRLATQNAGIGVFDYDTAAERALWSPELCELVGVPVGSIASLNDVLELVHPDDRARFLDGKAASNDPQGDGKFSDEFRIRRADTGEIHWLAKSCQTFFEDTESGRRAVRTIGVMMDITERKVREGHDQFLSDLSAAWIPARDMPALLQVTADALARHLDLNSVTLADVSSDVSVTTVGFRNGYGRTASPGTFVAHDYLSPSAQADLVAGRTLVVNDLTTDPRTAFASDRYLTGGARAMIVVPLLSDKGVRSALQVNTTRPRQWRPDEVLLLERVAARLWPTVERARAEEALRQSEERFEFLVALSDALRPLNDPSAMQETTVRLLGEHLKVNRVVYSDIEGTEFVVRVAYETGVLPFVRTGPILSFGAALLEAHRRGDTVHVNNVRTDPRFAESERAHLLSSEIVSFVRVMLQKDGRWTTAFSVHSAAPRVWTQAEVLLVRDVAERIWESVERAQATAAWRSTEARFRAFLENSPTTASLKDEEGRHVYVSPTYEKRFGVRLEDCRGKTVFDLWPKTVAEQFYQSDRAVLTADRPLEVLESAPNPDGTTSWWLSNKFSFKDASGGRYIGGIGLDVTDRKLAEEALRVADRRKNEFLATLAHELRNPMAALSMGLQLARGRTQLEPSLKRTLDMMDRQLTQLVRLVDDLLDVGRISAGKIGLDLEPLTLSQVLANSMEEVRAAVESRRHEVAVQIHPGQHQVRGDSARLTQVIANLIENAAKYTEPGGWIRVSLAREEDYEVVRVEDNGIGIPPEELPHVFDLFSQVRVHQGKSSEGLGIGLAIVRRLVYLHGGTVSAASAGLGHGSTFTIRLPALDEVTARPANGNLAQDRSKEISPRRRVLIVDDNQDAATALADFLNMAGHQTWIAHDGFQAIEIAKTTELDVAFMDLGMPGLDGIEAAKRIRRLPGRERLRIAALTGWGQDSDRARTRDAEFDWHLVKPINTAILGEIVAKLERGAPINSNGLKRT